MALALGKKLGPYEIQSPLGAGGMGEVYRARDTRLERSAAVKVLAAQIRLIRILRVTVIHQSYDEQNIEGNRTFVKAMTATRAKSR
jgi:serine/threonine protein kinase